MLFWYDLSGPSNRPADILPSDTTCRIASLHTKMSSHLIIASDNLFRAVNVFITALNPIDFSKVSLYRKWRFL